MTILSKSSNNGYSYVDGTDEKLTVNGNFELDEQRKTVLSANGNIAYDGAQTANFSTSMYNGVLQYSSTALRQRTRRRHSKPSAGYRNSSRRRLRQ